MSLVRVPAPQVKVPDVLPGSLAGERLEKWQTLDWFRRVLLSAAVLCLATGWAMAWSLRMHAVWALLAGSLGLLAVAAYLWLQLHGLIGLLGPSARRALYELSLRDLALRVSKFLWESQGTMLLLKLFFWVSDEAEIEHTLAEMPPAMRRAVERRGVIYLLTGEPKRRSQQLSIIDAEDNDDEKLLPGEAEQESPRSLLATFMLPSWENSVHESLVLDDVAPDPDADAPGAAQAPRQRLAVPAAAAANPAVAAAARRRASAGATGRGNNALSAWISGKMREAVEQARVAVIPEPLLRFLSPSALRIFLVTSVLTGAVHALATRNRLARRAGSMAIDLTLYGGTTIGLAGLCLNIINTWRQGQRARLPSVRSLGMSTVVVALWLLRIHQHRQRNQLRRLAFQATRGVL